MATRKRHSPEQIVRKLMAADRLLAEGKDLAAVCRELGVSEATYHRWRNQFGGLKAEDAKRLKDLERENATLKRLLADAELEKAALKEIAKGTSKPGTPADCRAPTPANAGGQRTVRLPGYRQHRATQRHPPVSTTPADLDAALREWLRAWAKDHRVVGFGPPIMMPAPRVGMSITRNSNGSGARRACGYLSVAAENATASPPRRRSVLMRLNRCGRPISNST
jgi:transposase-like protein